MSAARVLREGFLEMVVPNGVPKDKSWPGGADMWREHSTQREAKSKGTEDRTAL